MSVKTTRSNTLTIGRLSCLAEVGVDTVRFYERSGLLEAQERTQSGYRLYSRNSLARIQFICRMREIGLNLNQIKSILELHDKGGAKAEVKAFTTQMIAEVEEKIRGLTKWRNVLESIATHLEQNEIEAIDGETVDTLMRNQCDKYSH